MTLIHNKNRPSTDSLAAFDSARAWRDLVEQCDMGPRIPGTDAHAAARQWIVKRLRALRWEVEEQSFTGVPRLIGQEVEMTNIIASWKPERPRRILLSAHWDTRPLADMDPSAAHPFLGANDGASGVAVLLEIARSIALSPPQTIGAVLVFYDGEDSGKAPSLPPDLEDPLYMGFCLGSRHFANHLSERHRPEAAINLDMVAGRSMRFAPEGIGAREAPALTRDFFSFASKKYPAIFSPPTANSLSRAPQMIDDHLPLLRIGVQSIDLIDLTFSQWHTRADAPEACAEESLRIIGNTMLGWIHSKDVN